MTKTANAYVSDEGLLELQITSALTTAVGAPLDALDDGTWVDIRNVLRTFTPGDDPARAVNETYVAGDTTPIVTVSKKQPAHQPQFTLVDTNGKTEDYSTTNNINIMEHLIRPSKDNDLELPMRWSAAGGASGDQQETYSGNKILSAGKPGINADSDVPEEVTVTCRAESVTTSTIT